MKSKFRWMIGLVLIALIVVSCAPAAPVETEEPVVEEPVVEEPEVEEPSEVPVIKIGALLPLSGIDAVAGENQRKGHDFAVSRINEAGGISCLDGAQLQMVYGDSQSRAETGNTETERLITVENVVTVMGAFHTEVTLPATEISERYEVPFLVPNALAGRITERGLKYVFKTATALETTASSVAEFAQAMGAETAAIQFPDGTFGIEFANAFRDTFPLYDLEIVADVTTTWGATDFTDNILAMRAADPDVVFSVGSTPDIILMVRQMQEIGWWPRMGVIGPGGGWTDPSLVENLGDLAENVFVSTDWFPKSSLPDAEVTNEAFKAEYGIDMLGNINTTYAGTWLMAEALEIACSTDPKVIAETLRTERFEGGGYSFMYPYVKFDQNGYNETSINLVAQIQGGEPYTVFPEEYAIADPIWPGIPPAFEDFVSN